MFIDLVDLRKPKVKPEVAHSNSGFVPLLLLSILYITSGGEVCCSSCSSIWVGVVVFVVESMWKNDLLS